MSRPDDQHPSPTHLLPRAPRVPDLVVDDNGVTFLVVCAGGPITAVLVRLEFELTRGRRVSVVATPTAAGWLEHAGADITILERTGWPVRSELPPPTVATFEPPGSRLVVFPCTLNTLTKWADAHSDNLALSLLCEAVGRGVPTVAEVSLSAPYASLPAAGRALAQLDELGVELRRAPGSADHELLRPVPADLEEALAAARPPT